MPKNRFSARLAATIARLMPNHKAMLALGLQGPLASLGVDAMASAQAQRVQSEHWLRAPFGTSSNSPRKQKRASSAKAASRRARRLGHA